jgi:hypothetical protein
MSVGSLTANQRALGRSTRFAGLASPLLKTKIDAQS